MSSKITPDAYFNEALQPALSHVPHTLPPQPTRYEVAVDELETLLERLLTTAEEGSLASGVRVHISMIEATIVALHDAVPVSTGAVGGAVDAGLAWRSECLADALATDHERDDALRMFVLAARACERAYSWIRDSRSTPSAWRRLLTFEVCRCLLVYSSLHRRAIATPLLRQVCSLALTSAESAALEVWPPGDASDASDGSQPCA